MFEEVLQRELVLLDVAGKLLGLLLIHLGLGLLDETEHVAHAQDSLGHPVGMERLQIGDLLTHPDKFDWFICDVMYRESCAAACISIELGQDHARKADAIVEGARDVHRLLTGHRIGDEQDLIGINGDLHLLEFFHHRLVDVQAPSSVNEDNITQVLLCPFYASGCDLHRMLLISDNDGDLQVVAEGLQLCDCGRAIYVSGDEDRFPPFFLQVEGKLGRSCRLPRSLQADEHDDRRMV